MKALTPQQIARLQQMLAAAQQARQAGLNAQAEKLYRDILKEAPEAYDVHHQLAVLLATTGHPQEAIKHFRIVLKANPTHAPTHANLGNALLEVENFEEAIKEYKRALALDASLIWAYVHLGAALRKSGKPEEAIEHYKKALDLDRKNAMAFNGLGLAYRDLDDLPRALECMEHAVGLAPQDADFRLNFGVTLDRFEQPDLAAEQFYEVAALRPQSLEAVVFLGRAMQKLRRFDEAKECFDRALMLKPGEPELFENRGFVYLEMADTEHALADFQTVLVQYPERPRALLGLGRSHMEGGHSDQASATLEKLIEIQPDNNDAYFYLAGLRKFKPDDPFIPKLEALTDKVKVEDQSTATNLHFALGKIYDDCKKWDLAFSHYAKANRLRNQQYDYQPAEQEAVFDALKSVYTREFLLAHTDCATNETLPVFIVGMPRSGTTLTEQIISSHPQVIGAGEVAFWGQALAALPYALDATPYPECMKQIKPEQAHSLAERYVKQLRKIAGPDTHPARITDKMPHNFMHLGLLSLLFPNAAIINCKRDPMDNCLSIYFQSFGGVHPYAYDLANVGHHYRQYEKLMVHWHEVLPGRILDISYEDTIADPEYWSRRLIEHVGLEWNDACLAPHKLERTVKTASHWQVRQPIYKTSVQRWKNYEKHLGPLKQVLGYT